MSISKETLGLCCIFLILFNISGLAVFFLFSSIGIKKLLPSNTKTTGTKWGLNSESIVANLATLALSMNSSTSEEIFNAVSLLYYYDTRFTCFFLIGLY